jgi:D-glycero-D-manno-heptose 1,7-bisphosphate phosphatase
MKALPKFDRSWTLFLDRDGVINKKIENDYVKKWEDFHFLEGVHTALKKFSSLFGITVIVTNQQGIGKGVFTESDLAATHKKMVEEINKNGGRIDKIYFCPALAADDHPNRKPNTGMAFDALRDLPAIDFERSVMVGDSLTDMQFGRALGMFTVFIKDQLPPLPAEQTLIDRHFTSLEGFSASIV